MSFLGWLDHSEDEQRQVRELLQMFSDKGTVDDLGIGTVRDAISNRLFPGTSIIQTRARYFLFIPWIFRNAERKHRHRLLEGAELHERKLIDALIAGGDHEGLIGRQVRKDVRTLPSAIYWGGLSTYGIFQRAPLTRRQYDRLAKREPRATAFEDELVERNTAFWHAAIPDPPEDFFQFEGVDFQLTADESRWLAERMLSAQALEGPHLLGTYIKRLLDGRPTPSESFWQDPQASDLPAGLAAVTRDSERFSALVQGANILYNLMLRELRKDEERGDAKATESLREQFDEWTARATAVALPQWAADLSDFWAVLAQRARIPHATKAFVEHWGRLIAEHPLANLPDLPAARELIAARECQHKRVQARFANRTRLLAWGGDSGLAPLEYRWPLVHRLLSDIEQGLKHPAAQTTLSSHATH